jgi:hypothetical protein
MFGMINAPMAISAIARAEAQKLRMVFSSPVLAWALCGAASILRRRYSSAIGSARRCCAPQPDKAECRVPIE